MEDGSLAELERDPLAAVAPEDRDVGRGIQP
jgi:hypothetical protein